MPAAKKSTTTNGTAKKAAVSKRAKVEEAEDVEAPHELEVVVVAKKASAKAAAKASAAKNTKKRAREDDSDVEDSLEVETPKRSAKVTAKATKAAPLGAKATGKKASAAKKSATKDESDDESSFEEEKVAKKKTGARKAKSEEDEEAAAKKSSQKKASAKKSASDSDEDDGGEPVLVEIPTDFSSPSLSPGEMKIVSWNVAGYRAVLGKGFETYLKNEQPDIVCLQESKVISEREKMLFGYHAYFFGCKAKPGLHGTALFSKTKPIKVDFLTDFDEEGRVLLAEFPTFYIINTYVPNSGMKLERLAYRLDWDKKLQSMFLELQKKKPVIWCGDLNVAKDPIDLANPTGNKRTAGFTPQERESFNTFLETNALVDTYRTRHVDEKDCYSFWTYKRNSRAKNIGWRMDYFIVSPKIDASISHSYIRKHILGSDHCPIVIHLKP